MRHSQPYFDAAALPIDGWRNVRDLRVEHLRRVRVGRCLPRLAHAKPRQVSFVRLDDDLRISIAGELEQYVADAHDVAALDQAAEDDTCLGCHDARLGETNLCGG